MTDEPTDSTDPVDGQTPEGPTPGFVDRTRGFVGRARRAPGTVEDLTRSVEAIGAELAELRAAVARVEQRGGDGHEVTSRVETVAGEVHGLRARVDAVGEQVAALDGTVIAHAAAVRRTVQAPARAAAAAALRTQLGPAPDLRPGLSVFTLCWNHGPLLETSVRSAQAVLDLLEPDEQGEILILDDASTDTTAAVAAALAAEDPRIRVIRADENLGLGHARTTLLHTARTRHAFQLDADDVAVPAGVIDLYRTAVRTGACVTFGTIVQADADGSALGAVSNEPPTAAFFRSNYIGTLAVSDLAAYRELGGWPTDPLLEHVDDWSSLHQVIAEGRLLAFVPTLTAVYREWPTGFHHTVPDPRLGQERIARTYDPVGRHRGEDPLAGVAAVAVHPSTGPLWATAEAVALDPTLAPVAPPVVRVSSPTARILLIGPGGVSNLGDDAITVRAVDRARAAFGPDVAIDVITDGPPAQALGGRTRWLLPLHLAIHGLSADQLGALPPVLAGAPERAGADRARWRPSDPASYDAAIFLGCGLSSHWADGTIVPRALLAAALRTAGVPIAFSGQGYAIGDEHRDLMAALLGGAVAIGCRDQGSAVFAASLSGIDPQVVTVTGDDALGLAPATGDPTLTAFDRPMLAVTVRRADYVGAPEGDPVRRWALAADALAAARGWDVLGVALNSQPPEPEIATLATLRATVPLQARWRLVECGSDPARLAAAVTGAAAVAAQSYHAALFGLSAGVPSVLGAASDYYVAKAAGLAGLAELPAAFAVTEPDRLPEALDAVTAAVASRPAPLAGASAATDAWWATLPTALGVGATADG